jgi:hypothetical protein
VSDSTAPRSRTQATTPEIAALRSAAASPVQPQLADDSLEARIAQQRAQLEETLDAIEQKFNVPARASELAARAKRSYSANPVPWIVGATALVISVVGIVAWALSNDD